MAFARPGKQWCSIAWSPGHLSQLSIDLQVKRPQLVPLDGWVQVAPGGRWLAVRTETSELHVFSSTGSEVWHRAGVIAFHFSPSGGQLAISSSTGIEVISPARPEPRELAPTKRVEWLRWVDGGLLVSAGQRLLLIDDAGHERRIATLPKNALLTSSHSRAIFFSHGTMTDLDLAGGRPGPTLKLPVAAPVINADLAPDGSKVLFATKKGTYLIDVTCLAVFGPAES